MIQSVFEVIVHSGFQAIGWAALKAASFGRYQGFRPEDIHLEGTLGFAIFAGVAYVVYRLLF